ncbi:MAG: ABC transporter substrate-binding protein [Desulfobacteraceae bacterium]|nr:MAG: ABC transporter substrate-binding protein [Desulfobacteraceae bacterium]
MKKTAVFLLCIFFASVSFSADTGPMDALKGPVDEGIRLLSDPKYKNPSLKRVQREKIWEIVRKAFDFTELSGRALAANWKTLNPQQRKEFTEVFSDVLGNTYLDKIQGGFRDEKVAYLGQEKVSDTKAVVKTKIIREKGEIPVDYSMRFKNDSWKVYDVHVEGVSLVQNYRSQFNEILSKDSPDELIKRLEKKLAEQQKGDSK